MPPPIRTARTTRIDWRRRAFRIERRHCACWRFALAGVALVAAAVAWANGSIEPIRPIPVEVAVDPARAALGERLFHDPQLSKDNTVSCATCHDLERGGDDGRPMSVGVGDSMGVVNAPTVFNVAFNFKQFWDGRADTLEAQIDGPITSPVEMGSLWPDVVAKLYRDETYPAEFAAIYADGINRANVKNALAEFMRALTTPNSRFDAWLAGDRNALNDTEERGYALFKSYGCASCHQGANVGGNMFQVFGVINSYFTRRGNITEADRGRFNVTGNDADMHAFKVPSLRMAAHTAPYLHDGTAWTLRDAVDIMFEFQLGREAPDSDKDAIVAFIRTLAGERAAIPAVALAAGDAATAPGAPVAAPAGVQRDAVEEPRGPTRSGRPERDRAGEARTNEGPTRSGRPPRSRAGQGQTGEISP